MTPEIRGRDAAHEHDGGARAPREFTRRIDCAPSPRPAAPVLDPHPGGHGAANRAPGARAT